MDITLKDLTVENYQQSVKLNVNAEQVGFVAPNVYSIAQSKFYSSWKPTAIYNENEMVGFLMYGEDDDNEGDETIWIIRLMIDFQFQGKGYGKTAMLKLIEHIKSNYDQEELFVSFIPDNSAAKNLYESLGFENTGRIENAELVYKLKLIG